MEIGVAPFVYIFLRNTIWHQLLQAWANSLDILFPYFLIIFRQNMKPHLHVFLFSSQHIFFAPSWYPESSDIAWRFSRVENSFSSFEEFHWHLSFGWNIIFGQLDILLRDKFAMMPKFWIWFRMVIKIKLNMFLLFAAISFINIFLCLSVMAKILPKIKMEGTVIWAHWLSQGSLVDGLEQVFLLTDDFCCRLFGLLQWISLLSHDGMWLDIENSITIQIYAFYKCVSIKIRIGFARC